MDQHTLIQKAVVVFAKDGPAIYHSHHDMIRFWERAIKRAGLPVRMTQGFNPRPRIIFPHALGLGIASDCEQIEIELCQPVDNQDLLGKIKDAAGDTLGIVRTFNLPASKRSRQIVATSYEITGWPEDLTVSAIQDAIRQLLEMTAIDVVRGAPGKERSLDVRPYVETLAVSPDHVVSLRLTHSPTGTARPDEIVSCLTRIIGIEKYGLSVRKIAMELTDSMAI